MLTQSNVVSRRKADLVQRFIYIERGRDRGQECGVRGVLIKVNINGSVVFTNCDHEIGSNLVQFNSIQFSSIITCTFRPSCYSTRLSWAHTSVINCVVCLGQKVSS